LGAQAMAHSWQRRLGIAVTIVWILLWTAGYLSDPSKDLRASIFGVTLFGIVPLTICWLIWWIWDAVSRDR